LAETSIVYDTNIQAKPGFWIRLLTFRTKGNCEEAEQCATDKLIAVTSAFDEEPEQRAFENGQKDKCNAYSVSLRKVRHLKTPCP
jgi:hypothetical protein